MKKYTVASYYFPQWHHDPQHSEDMKFGEWDRLKNAVPRFEGHNQPKTPLWGYLDESDPKTSELQINAASSSGIDVFIYDWYWDLMGEGTGKFLQGALDNGFLQAPNRSKMKFALLLCNHKTFSRERWEKMTDCIIEEYFPLPEYWEIDGAKYFSIYELNNLVKSMGSMQGALDAINSFREKALKKGYKIHFNIIQWGLQEHSVTGENESEAVKFMGGDSVTSYVWIHNYVPKAEIYAPYSKWREGAMPYWDKFDGEFGEYYPNVSQGWDSSGRFDPEKEYIADNSPNAYFCTIMHDNTPDEFEKSLKACRDFLDRSSSKHKIVTLYAWNEWTEGGYLEPEKKYGYGYLDAIKKVFCE